MNFMCGSCRHLRKDVKEITSRAWEKEHYRYGCASHGFIIGSITKDSELNTMGCSDFENKPKIVEYDLFKEGNNAKQS